MAPPSDFSSFAFEFSGNFTNDVCTAIASVCNLLFLCHFAVVSVCKGCEDRHRRVVTALSVEDCFTGHVKRQYDISPCFAQIQR